MGPSDIFEKHIADTIKKLIKKQNELRKSEERYRIVAEATKDIIWEGDLINKKRYFSGKLKEILGYDQEELEGLEDWFNIVHPEDVASVRSDIRRQIREKIEVEAFEYRVRAKDGSYKWLFSNTKCEFNDKGEAVSAFGAFTDITELKEQQKRIHDLAYYDSVTGLPNRVVLKEVVDEKIQKGNMFSMIFMDLDNFKFVNDSFGHLMGDKLLVEVGKRLREVDNDKVMSFRLGGDEFIILVGNIEGKEEVELLSKYLHKVLSSPFLVDGHMFHVNHSSGVVIYPEDGDDFQELLKNADTAMYKSKDSGKGTNSFYHSKMGREAVEKARIEGDLHKAIENNEFQLYYQPIVDVTYGRIKGCEALIRWNHPHDGMIQPDKFIPIAEENGTIINIGKWVFETACQYAKKMHDSGYRDFYVSVNISPHQLLQKEFTDFILSTIKRVGISSELVVIEITESVLIESMDLAIRKLKKLRNNNIKIALDDFGCGYSSLTYLRTLPINIVKVDRSFISDIQSLEDTRNMTNIIILLARQLGLSVTAEGVEDMYQLDYLKRHGCDKFQGYLRSRPVPETEFLNLMSLQAEA
ncbi:MAG: EAL domain-containing protein [Bacillota bacterium]|nr:EAL domain-containing protein [Bacillota bacterium]